MSNVVDPVSRGIPARERTQVFTSAGAGDIIKVEESLGRPAQSVSIESVSGMSVRFNVVHSVAPPREGNDLMYTKGMPNLALSNECVDDSQTPIPIGAGETFVSDDIPVKDIQIVSVTGAFTIIVS